MVQAPPHTHVPTPAVSEPANAPHCLPTPARPTAPDRAVPHGPAGGCRMHDLSPEARPSMGSHLFSGLFFTFVVKSGNKERETSPFPPPPLTVYFPGGKKNRAEKRFSTLPFLCLNFRS